MSVTTYEAVHAQENLLARLDRIPVNRKVLQIVFLLGLVWICEAFDIGIIAPVLSLVKHEWNLTPQDVGLIGSVGTIGIVVGLIPAGWMADRFGRKPVLIFGLVLCSAFTFLASLSSNVHEMAVCRFLAGLGQAAIFPVPYLMISELVNKKWRGTTIALCNSTLGFAYGLNTLAAALIIGKMSDEQAWRLLLIIGGSTIVILPLVIFFLPESPRFLLKKGRIDEVKKFVESLESVSRLPHDEVLVDLARSQTQQPEEKGKLRELLQPVYLKRCLAAFIAQSTQFSIFYVITIYGPSIIERMGATKAEAFYYLSALLTWTVVTTIVGGLFGDKISRRWGIVFSMTGVSLATFLIGQDLSHWAVVTTAILLWGFTYGAGPIIKCYMAEQFPTRLRGTGCMMGESVSRFFSGVVLVYMFPILEASMSSSTLFTFLAVLPIVGLIPALLWGIETTGLSMEETATTKGLGTAGGRQANLGTLVAQSQPTGR